jgi:probable rRNA maturation factor
MSELVLWNRQRVRCVNTVLLRRIVRSLLNESASDEDYELGVYLVGASKMTKLNETFLRHAGSTDVITFDHAVKADVGRRSKKREPSKSPDVGCYKRIHGEIFVCMDEAVRQARQFRTNWQSELVRYVVHGVLHLTGFDDLKPVSRRKMKREENRLLRELTRRWPPAQLAKSRKSA